ncbi:MAG: hypothetical protein J07HQX50_00611 [Haloquadratum sp. J07HQX50]|nr:MAG: hypothetical protein J07HQX50_00611 [Haloquadratum sp. J07HQX50]
MWSDTRGQAAVVGVALLLGVTVVAISGLTATTGSIVADGIAVADLDRVSGQLQHSLATTNYPKRTEIRLTRGQLQVANRSIWLLEGGSIQWAGHAGAVIYTDGPRELVAFGGTVVQATPESVSQRGQPRIATAPDSLYIGVPLLDTSGLDAVSTSGHQLSVGLTATVESDQTMLAPATYAVGIETDYPEVWAKALTATGASTTTQRDIDGDGIVSVIGHFEQPRAVHLVRHIVEIQLEVS